MKKQIRLNPKKWFAVLLILVLCFLSVQASAYIDGEKYRYYCTGCGMELSGSGRCPYCGSSGKKEIPTVTRSVKWASPYVNKTANGYDVGATFTTEQAGDLLFNPDNGKYYLQFKATLLYNNKKVKANTVKAYETGEITGSGAYVFKAKLKFSLPSNCQKGDYTIRIHAFVSGVHGGPCYEQAKTQITVSGQTEEIDVAISKKNFPDDKFRNYIKRFDTSRNGRFSKEEIRKITEMNVSGKGISDLKGIEYFTELTMLYCGSNQLKTLDLSKNTKLQFLECAHTQLSSLNISNNPDLGMLWCMYSKITKLDISNCKPLCSIVRTESRKSRRGYDYFGLDPASLPYLGVDCNTKVIAGSFTSNPTSQYASFFTEKGGIKYVLNKGTKNAIVLYPANNKTIVKAIIPASLSVNGVNYPVTEISDQAFMYTEKLTTLVIGKNVRKIGDEICPDNHKLKSITIESLYLTDSSVGYNAFYGIHPEAVIKCPKEKLEEYRKILLKHGLPETSTFQSI